MPQRDGVFTESEFLRSSGRFFGNPFPVHDGPYFTAKVSNEEMPTFFFDATVVPRHMVWFFILNTEIVTGASSANTERKSLDGYFGRVALRSV